MNKKIENTPDYPSYKKEANIVFVISACAVLLSLIISSYVIINSNQKISEIRKVLQEKNNHIFIVDKKDGSVFLAKKQEIDTEVRTLEHQEVARLYALNMYSFDKYTYEDHMTKGILLSNEETGIKEYENYQELNIYSDLLYEGLAISAIIDSVKTTKYDENSSEGFLYMKQWIHKPNGSLGYRFAFKYKIKNTQERNADNMYGAQVVMFQVYQKNNI